MIVIDQILCIYGAGKYGIEIYYQLKNQGIQVDFFSDRNKEKWGYALDGIFCISPQELLKFEKTKTTIIIGIKNNIENLYKHFNSQGIYKVIRWHEISDYFGETDKRTENCIIKEQPYLMELHKEFCNAMYKKNSKKISDCTLQKILTDYEKRNE